MKIIDVSEHNGKIDFNKVKADGIEGVIIRAGYGKGNVDKTFTSNITGAIKAELHIGIYWFSYAFTEDMARREARFCNDIIAPYKVNIDLPVFFDWEYDSMKYAKKNNVAADKDLITKMTKAFCEEITSLGYVAGYYLNLDYSKNYYDEDQLSEYKRWFARYVKTEQKDCYLWQNSNKGTVDGISGSVDTDVLMVEMDVETPEPKIEEQTVDTIESLEKPAETPQTSSGKYIVGRLYTVSVKSALNVRTGAGKNYGLVGYSGLTADAKKHSMGSALKNGTKVTCLEVKKISDDNIWIRIPSGWISAVDGNKTFVV